MSSIPYPEPMDANQKYVIPNEPNMDRILTPQDEAEDMIEQSGLSSAKEWSHYYLDKAVTEGDVSTASYWQAVVVRVSEIEAERVYPY